METKAVMTQFFPVISNCVQKLPPPLHVESESVIADHSQVSCTKDFLGEYQAPFPSVSVWVQITLETCWVPM